MAKWSLSVDQWAAFEHGNKMAGSTCEEWESMVMTLLESNLTGDSWRLRKWAGVDISPRMSHFFSSPENDSDPNTLYSLNGESVREWFRRVTPQTCDGSFSQSVISFSSGNSSTMMTASSLSDADKEVMDMTIRSAQNLIVQLKAMVARQAADIRKYWSERRSFVSIINEYRKEMGDIPLARAETSSNSDSSIQSIDQGHIDTSTLSETCRNHLLVRDSVLKDLQVVQQQEASRKRDRSLDLSIEEISPLKETCKGKTWYEAR